jgi:hypothetical protein
VTHAQAVTSVKREVPKCQESAGLGTIDPRWKPIFAVCVLKELSHSNEVPKTTSSVLSVLLAASAKSKDSKILQRQLLAQMAVSASQVQEPRNNLIVLKGISVQPKQQETRCLTTLVIKDFTVKLKLVNRPRQETIVHRRITVPQAQVFMIILQTL